MYPWLAFGVDFSFNLGSWLAGSDFTMTGAINLGISAILTVAGVAGAIVGSGVIATIGVVAFSVLSAYALADLIYEAFRGESILESAFDKFGIKDFVIFKGFGK